MTKEMKVTSEPSNLPIQLKYILRYAERVMVDGSSFSFQLLLELFGIPRNSYVLREDVIDFCNMQKVKTLSMVAYIMFQSTVECGYYVMRYMRESVSKDTNIITDVIDRRNSYSQLELDEIRVEWAEFLARYI
ncbi:hypothetical protein IC582_011428 [Cucumis melo]